MSGGSCMSAKFALSVFKKIPFEIATHSTKLKSAPPPHFANLKTAPPPYLAKLESAPPPHLAKLKSAPPPHLTVLKTAQWHLNPKTRGS